MRNHLQEQVRRAWTGAPSRGEAVFPRAANLSREEQWAAKSKVIGAGDRQRQRDGEGGSEQNGAIESASIAAAAIFASFHCASGPSASELAFQPDNALPPDSW